MLGITILLFLLYSYGLGYACTFWWKESGYERQIMRVSIGIAAMVVLIVVLDLLKIPLDWKIFLGIGIVLSAVMFMKERPSFKLHMPGRFIMIVLVLFIATLFMYTKGSFAYPHLEDDDPWAHATGIKYISVEKNLKDPHQQFGYIDPYPPGYDGLFAILHQTSPNLVETMKFFNALICALGILFFGFFARKFFNDWRHAAFATFILAMIPSYLSHFIWAHSLVTTLFIVSLYCLLRISEDKNWIFPTAVVIAGICMSQPDQPVKYGVMYAIFLVISSICKRKILWSESFAVLGGYALSLLWWLPRASGFLKGIQASTGPAVSGGGLWSTLQRIFPPGSGTGTRAYTFSDFFIAKGQNMINNPIGLGIAISLLTLLGVWACLAHMSKKDSSDRTISLLLVAWVVFTFLGVNSLTFHLPIGLHAFRFWMLLSIPVALIAAKGAMQLIGSFPDSSKGTAVLIILVLVIFTAGIAKYQVNTAQWRAGAGWTSEEELQGYLSLFSLPQNTKVFTYGDAEATIGMNAYDCMWCDDVVKFKKDALLVNATAMHSWLQERDYSYLIVSARTIRELEARYGNATSTLVNTRVQDLIASKRFVPQAQNPAMVLLRIV